MSIAVFRIRGTPLIFGFDNMHFNAFISAGDEGSIDEERRRKHIPKQQQQQLYHRQAQKRVFAHTQLPVAATTVGEKRRLFSSNAPVVGEKRRLRRGLDFKFAFAVYIDGANFNSIIETFVGSEQSSLCWLKDLKAGIR